VLDAKMAAAKDWFDLETGSEPSRCQVKDLKQRIIAGTTHEFSIIAHNLDGVQTTGGEAFFVAVHGMSRIRARVADNDDGTYTVTWRPTVSGRYHVAVSLFGNHINGSPFSVIVLDSAAYAPRCESRGKALESVVSRTPVNFDVVFRDRSGAPCKAVELDGPRDPHFAPASAA
jgi:hypothetical protein